MLLGVAGGGVVVAANVAAIAAAGVVDLPSQCRKRGKVPTS